MLDMLDKSTQKGKALVIFLAVALLIFQSIQVHFHFYDHNHDVAEYDTHQSFAHSSYSSLEFDHHNETVTVEFSDHFFNRSTALKSLFSVFFVVIFLVFLPFLVNRKSRKTLNFIFPPPKRYSQGPQLRAPPLF